MPGLAGFLSLLGKGDVCFLEAEVARDRTEVALASEEVLARDWLRAEEDEAWRDL